MKTVGEIVRLSIDYVQKKGGRPRREVEEWVAHTLGLQRLDLYLQFDRPLEDGELVSIRTGISRLCAGEPLAYIIGFAPFYGHDFEVSPDVLIPRPETETLITVVQAFLASQKTPGTIVDLCTGSGCIGLTLKMLFPQWNVVLIDISEKALVLARRNAHRLNLEVEIIQGNLLEPFSGRKAEVVVANPPYLSSSEWFSLDPSVATFEPRLALEAGVLGTEVYQNLLKQIPQHLVSKGFCAVEIGASQGEAVLSLAQQFCAPFLTQDLAGHDRVVAFSCHDKMGAAELLP
jgi:release factor glutamine methyltransferase